MLGSYNSGRVTFVDFPHSAQRRRRRESGEREFRRSSTSQDTSLLAPGVLHMLGGSGKVRHNRRLRGCADLTARADAPDSDLFAHLLPGLESAAATPRSCIARAVRRLGLRAAPAPGQGAYMDGGADEEGARKGSGADPPSWRVAAELAGGDHLAPPPGGKRGAAGRSWRKELPPPAPSTEPSKLIPNG